MNKNTTSTYFFSTQNNLTVNKQLMIEHETFMINTF